MTWEALVLFRRQKKREENLGQRFLLWFCRKDEAGPAKHLGFASLNNSRKLWDTVVQYVALGSRKAG